jgi:hypothetical protein
MNNPMAPKQKKLKIKLALSEKFRRYAFLAVRFVLILSPIVLIIISLGLVIKSKYFDTGEKRIGIFLTKSSKIWFSGKRWNDRIECNPNYAGDNLLNLDAPLYITFENSPANILVEDSDLFEIIVEVNTDVTLEFKGYVAKDQTLDVSSSEMKQIKIKAKGLNIHHTQPLKYYTLALCGPSIAYWPGIWTLDYSTNPPYSLETLYDIPLGDKFVLNIDNASDINEIIPGGEHRSLPGSFDELDITIIRNTRDDGLFGSQTVGVFALNFSSFPILSPGLDLEFRFNNPETILSSATGISNEFLIDYPEGWFETNNERTEFGNTSQSLYVVAASDGDKLDISDNSYTEEYDVSIIGASSSATLDGQPLFRTEWDKLPVEIQIAYLSFLYSALAGLVAFSYSKRKAIYEYLFRPILPTDRIPQKLGSGKLVIQLTSGKVIAGTFLREKKTNHTISVIVIKDPMEKEGDFWKRFHEGELEVPVEKIELKYFSKE